MGWVATSILASEPTWSSVLTWNVTLDDAADTAPSSGVADLTAKGFTAAFAKFDASSAKRNSE